MPKVELDQWEHVDVSLCRWQWVILQELVLKSEREHRDHLKKYVSAHSCYKHHHQRANCLHAIEVKLRAAAEDESSDLRTP